MLKQEQIEEKGLKAFRDCFSVVPNLEVSKFEVLQKQVESDFRVHLRGEDYEKIVYIEMKTLGTPKTVREAVNQLLMIQNREPESYGVVVAPFISKNSAGICKQADIGYIDLSGNFWISFDTIFLSRDKMPNRYPYNAGLSSLYSPKTERVLRVLLTYPNRVWKTVDLAEEADISLGMITHIRRKLEEEEWAEKQEVGFILSQPDALLEDWSNQYDFTRNLQYNFYTMKKLPEIEAQIDQVCTETEIDYALTGFSASNRLAPIVKGQKSMVYIGRDIPRVAQLVGLKSVDSGSNVTLIQPYDEGVFWNKQILQDIQIATPVQVFLDLKQVYGRGDEAADFLYQEVIRKRWQHQKSNMIKS